MQTESAENGTLETWSVDEVADALEKGEIAQIGRASCRERV